MKTPEYDIIDCSNGSFEWSGVSGAFVITFKKSPTNCYGTPHWEAYSNRGQLLGTVPLPHNADHNEVVHNWLGYDLVAAY